MLWTETQRQISLKEVYWEPLLEAQHWWESEQSRMEQREKYNAFATEAGINRPGSSGARTVFKDVRTEAMGPGLWTPHQLVIEFSCDQSAVKGPRNRQNEHFGHKERVYTVCHSIPYLRSLLLCAGEEWCFTTFHKIIIAGFKIYYVLCNIHKLLFYLIITIPRGIFSSIPFYRWGKQDSGMLDNLSAIGPYKLFPYKVSRLLSFCVCQSDTALWEVNSLFWWKYACYNEGNSSVFS